MPVSSSDKNMQGSQRGIYVTMLGNFTLRYEDAPQESAVMANLTGRARRLWMLLAYLIINRERGVSSQELIELFWPDENIANPQSTLQNNVSRLRKLLADGGFSDSKRLVVCDAGLYRWAPHIQTIVDADVFERAARRLDPDENGAQADEALATCLGYDSDFLEHAQQEPWCVSRSIYYRSLFTALCHKTLAALARARRVGDVEKLCLHAVEIDPSAEEFNLFLMRTLIRNGNPRKALDHYDRIKRIYEEDFGASVPIEMDMERENAMSALYGQGVSADAIRRLLDEPDEGGAFLCSNAVFREIVQLRRHELQRNSKPSHVASVTFRSKGDEDRAQKTRNAKRFERMLAETLRSGDAFTKVGQDQFLVLLPEATKQDSQAALARVIDSFHGTYPQAQIDPQLAFFDLTAI